MSFLLALLCPLALLLALGPLSSLAQTRLSFTIVEESPPNLRIGSIRQRLAATGRYLEADLATFSYKLLTVSTLIRVDKATGDIFTEQRIDRESLCSMLNVCCNEDEEDSGLNGCQLKFQIALLPRQVVTSAVKELLLIEVSVEDINDNAPSWRSGVIRLEIPEHTALDTTFKLPTATDPDRGPDNTTARYGIAKQSSPGMFSLDAQAVTSAPSHRRRFDLWLKVNRDLNREEAGSHRVTMYAADDGRPARTGTVLINITVTDINDQKPTFRQMDPRTSVREDIAAHTIVFNMSAWDRDTSDRQQLRYRLGSSADAAVMRAFRIDPASGVVTVRSELDYERHRRYVIPVSVTDGKHVTETTLTIEVMNVNDNRPNISINSMSTGNERITILENQPPETTVATISVDDKDDKRRQEAIDCLITGTHDFALRPWFMGRLGSRAMNMHRLVTKIRFDREQQIESRGTIECTDRAEPRMTTKKNFRVIIEDENDSPPVFQNDPVTAKLQEDRPEGTKVVQVQAKDADAGENAKIWYALDSQSQQRFSIDRYNGVIRTKGLFDRELIAMINITVLARDRASVSEPSSSRAGSRLSPARHVVPINTATVTVQVAIEDANDCAPTFEQSSYELQVRENSRPDTEVGRLRASDLDVTSPNNRVTYFMTKERGNKAHQFFKVMSNGVVLTRRGDVDREDTPIFSFTAVAKDGGTPAQSTTVTVVVRILDMNDNKPRWSIPSTQQRIVNISYDIPVGTRVIQLVADDRDEGSRGELEYYIKRGNEHGIFELDQSSGNLYVARPLNKPDIRNHQLMVEARDKGPDSRSTLAVLDVNVLPLLPTRPTNKRRTDHRQLVILISIVTVTLIISLFLIAAIVFLRCSRCRKPFWPARRRPSANGRATYFPDGERRRTWNSSPAASDVPNLTKAKLQTVERLRPLYTETKFPGEDADSLDSGRGCSSDTGGAARSDSVLMQKMNNHNGPESPHMNPYSIDGKRPTPKASTFRTPQLDGRSGTVRGRFSVTWDPAAASGDSAGTLPQSSYQHLSSGVLDENSYSNVPEEEAPLGMRRDDYNDVRAYTPLTHARVSSPNLYTRQPTSFV